MNYPAVIPVDGFHQDGFRLWTCSTGRDQTSSDRVPGESVDGLHQDGFRTWTCSIGRDPPLSDVIRVGPMDELPSGRVPTTSCRTGSASRRRRRSWTAARSRRGAGEGLRHLPVVLRAGDASEDALRGGPRPGHKSLFLPTQATFSFSTGVSCPGVFSIACVSQHHASVVHRARVPRASFDARARSQAARARGTTPRVVALASGRGSGGPSRFRARGAKTSETEATTESKHRISLTAA